MNSRLAYLASQRQQLATEYGIRRKGHKARVGTAQQLKRKTTELLAAELRAQREAARLMAKAGTLAGDLDLFLNL